MTTYQKVMAAYGTLRKAINGRMSKYDVARQFNEKEQYRAGQLVVNEDALWMCTNGHLGPWDGADFSRATVDDAIAYDVQKTFLKVYSLLASKTDIAPEFSPSGNYDVNMLVVHENTLYRCIASHHSAQWNESHFEETNVEDVLERKLLNIDVAGEFSPGASYDVGQLVVYNNELYRCTTAHSGAWGDGSHFTSSTVDDAMSLKASASSVNSALSQKASVSSLAQKADKTEIAPLFDPYSSYEVGQLVVYNNELYRCKTAHSGAWSEGVDFTESKVSDALDIMAKKSELSALNTSLSASISQRALKTELGYFGTSYYISDYEEIQLHDMEVASVKVSSNYDFSSGPFMEVSLPDTGETGSDGTFHSCRCSIIFDMTDIDIGSTCWVKIGSSSDTVHFSDSAGDVQAGFFNIYNITYAGVSEGKRIWLCEQRQFPGAYT